MKNVKSFVISVITTLLTLALIFTVLHFMNLTDFDVKSKIDHAEKSVVTVLSGFDSGKGILTDDYVMGSGFAYDKTKIVTNAHNIKSDNINILTYNNEIIPANVIAKDNVNDIAILKIDIELPYFEFGNIKKCNKGDSVYNISTPLSVYLKNSYSQGMITNVDVSGLSNQKLLQTDIAVSPGCSGSPLFNDKFQVIGMLSFKSTEFGSDRLGFAIPCDLLIERIKKLEGGGESFDLKISFQSDIYQKYGFPNNGITIENIAEDSKAYSKLYKNDVIIEINGDKIENITMYYETIRKYENEKMIFKIIRDGKQINIEI